MKVNPLLKLGAGMINSPENRPNKGPTLSLHPPFRSEGPTEGKGREGATAGCQPGDSRQLPPGHEEEGGECPPLTASSCQLF